MKRLASVTAIRERSSSRFRRRLVAAGERVRDLLPEFAAEVDRACDLRHWWYAEQMLDICQRNGPFGLAATRQAVAPLQRQLNRLARRPGWKRARG